MLAPDRMINLSKAPRDVIVYNIIFYRLSLAEFLSEFLHQTGVLVEYETKVSASQDRMRSGVHSNCTPIVTRLNILRLMLVKQEDDRPRLPSERVHIIFNVFTTDFDDPPGVYNMFTSFGLP
jgi:hypothetical protein